LSKGSELLRDFTKAAAAYINARTPTELAEARQVLERTHKAVIEAIDGPDGFVMVETPIPSSCLECCFNYDCVQCKHPARKESDIAISGVMPGEIAAWCPFISGKEI